MSTDDKSFDYIRTVHDDYMNHVAHLRQLGESILSDFRMLSVLIPVLVGGVAGLSGVTKINETDVLPCRQAPGLSYSFCAFAAIATMVALFGVRDYVRVVILEHQLRITLEYESHYRNLIEVHAQESGSVAPTRSFIDACLPKLARISRWQGALFLLSVVVAPSLLLTTSCGWDEGAIFLGYAVVLFGVHTWIGAREFHRDKTLLRLSDVDPSHKSSRATRDLG